MVFHDCFPNVCLKSGNFQNKFCFLGVLVLHLRRYLK